MIFGQRAIFSGAPTSGSRRQPCGTKSFVTLNGFAHGGVAQANFFGSLRTTSPALLRAKDLSAALVLLSRTELSGIFFSHGQKMP
jgi:hypothetical protein